MMPKLEPDSVNPKCECGEYLAAIERWDEVKGKYWVFRCLKCWEYEEESNE